MTDETEAPHLYGTPIDPKPPAEEGLRGEKATPLAEPPAEQTHSEIMEGRKVTVVETSGTAFVEATGKAGFDKTDS